MTKPRKPDKKIQTMLDNGTLIEEDGKLLKLVGHGRGHGPGEHSLKFVEVDPEDYDRRVRELANKIASCPGVDVLSIVRDALYDLTLTDLERLETKINTALEEAQKTKTEPKVVSKTHHRGTCVNLEIDGRWACNLRY